MKYFDDLTYILPVLVLLILHINLLGLAGVRSANLNCADWANAITAEEAELASNALFVPCQNGLADLGQ